MGEQAAVGGERKKRRDEEESYAGEKRLSRHTCAPRGSSDNVVQARNQRRITEVLNALFLRKLLGDLTIPL